MIFIYFQEESEFCKTRKSKIIALLLHLNFMSRFEINVAKGNTSKNVIDKFKLPSCC